MNFDKINRAKQDYLEFKQSSNKDFVSLTLNFVNNLRCDELVYVLKNINYPMTKNDDNNVKNIINHITTGSLMSSNQYEKFNQFCGILLDNEKEFQAETPEELYRDVNFYQYCYDLLNQSFFDKVKNTLYNLLDL